MGKYSLILLQILGDHVEHTSAVSHPRGEEAGRFVGSGLFLRP